MLDLSVHAEIGVLQVVFVWRFQFFCLSLCFVLTGLGSSLHLALARRVSGSRCQGQHGGLTVHFFRAYAHGQPGHFVGFQPGETFGARCNARSILACFSACFWVHVAPAGALA